MWEIAFFVLLAVTLVLVWKYFSVSSKLKTWEAELKVLAAGAETFTVDEAKKVYDKVKELLGNL